jgi:hypothetical protein
MAEFKVGDPVYHKATLKRGVLTGVDKNGQIGHVTWKEGSKQVPCFLTELYTEKEGKQKINEL